MVALEQFYRRHHRSVSQARCTDELANYYNRFRRMGEHWKLVGYMRLMRHWHAAYSGRIRDVHYAALTQDPERVVREVCRFCGLDFEPGMLTSLRARTMCPPRARCRCGRR